MKYLILFLVIFMVCSPLMAEQIYVKANADLPEVVADEPFVVTPQLKQFLNYNAPTHPEYGVKYLTRQIAKVLLQTSGRKAQQVLNALEADGNILPYSDRYSELYPSEETP